MCGRYATALTAAVLNAEFEIELANSLNDLAANYNQAPTDLAPIVVQRPGRGAEAEHRALLKARWGLIPSWAKDPAVGNRMINARADTVAEKPSFRSAFASRRALVPASGYYEWYVRADATKQPFFIAPKDRSVLAMAGLYEFWRDPGGGDWIMSFTILTTSAEDVLGHVHDRMPLIVEREGYGRWLDPASHSAGTLLDLLVPAAPGRLDAFPVSRAVGNVRNNGPELIEPLPLAEGTMWP